MADPGPTPASFPRRVWLLALGAVAVRALGAATLQVVAADGSRYLWMSRLLLEGRWGEALAVPPVTHPLYPLMVAFGQAVTGNALLSALAVSSILGGLAVLPLYRLAARAWNDRTAFTAGLLYAVLPSLVDLHADAMLEGTFMCFFFTAMALGWSSLERKSWERAALAGAAMAAAWLTRPEGAYLPMLFALACVLRRSRFAMAALALAGAVALVLAMPYAFYIRKQTGKFGISANAFSAGIVGLLTGETKATGYEVNEKTAQEYGEYRDIYRYGKVGGPIFTLSKTVSRNLFHILVPFLLVGFWFLRSEDFRAGPAAYLLVAAGGYFIPPVLAFAAGTPFSHRYILIPCVLVLPVAAIGLLKAGAWARRREALPAFLVLLCGTMAVRDVLPHRKDKIGWKLAGLAIREKLGPDRKILAMSHPITFYAQGEYIDFPGDVPFEDLRRTVKERGVSAIAIHAGEFRYFKEDLRKHLDDTYPLLGEYPSPAPKHVSPVRVYIMSP
jgi:4-amino-4-deoxy-L-arabinose transferase-like glycosyltransferase